MAKELAIPFFVYKKQQKEAYFIVINTSKNAKIKNIKGVSYDGDEGIVQEGKFAWPSRYTLGA